jgi:7,8-dihydro-6-hydroxymethylpterin-pyrophosphokinase
MAPLAEILPDWIHPVLKKTNRKILAELKDDLGVKAINTDNYSVANEKDLN